MLALLYHLFESKEIKYQWITENSDKYSIKKMANILNVSTSGYYESINRPASRRAIENIELLDCIISIMDDTNWTYGSPCVTAELKDVKGNINHKRVENIMQSNNITAQKPRVYRVKTTDSSHKYPISPDLVQRNFDPGELNKIWVSDITYIETTTGFSYLTIFHDLGNREPVGWHLSKNLGTEGVIMALDKAVKKRNYPKGLIVHSDRGIQYASNNFRKFLYHNDIRQSMSRKGNCWDNAVAESFFHSLKTECLYRLEKIPTYNELERILFDYIEIFYIRKRRHSSLGYQTPVDYGRMIA